MQFYWFAIVFCCCCFVIFLSGAGQATFGILAVLLSKPAAMAPNSYLVLG